MVLIAGDINTSTNESGPRGQVGHCSDRPGATRAEILRQLKEGYEFPGAVDGRKT